MSDDTLFYRALEDRFRGSRELITARLQVYRPYLMGLLDLFDTPEALDIGCGRGEWLALLTDFGFIPRGIDLDEGMLASCREKGLAVENGDGIAWLAGMKDRSLALVSAFHVVEHLPFSQVYTLVKEALRVLQPGGLLILETPNPENPAVGAHTFYLDPTHEKPLPPELLEFLPEYCGYHRTRLLRLQEPKGLTDNPAPNLADVLFNASPDYALVAQKTGAPDQLARLDILFRQSLGIDPVTLAYRYETALTTRFNDLELRMDRQWAVHHQERKALADELKLIYGSRSWWITRPLRWATETARTFKSRYKTTLKSIRNTRCVDRVYRLRHPAHPDLTSQDRDRMPSGMFHRGKAAGSHRGTSPDDLTTEELLRRIRHEIQTSRQQGDKTE